jgi:hypothetical protein
VTKSTKKDRAGASDTDAPGGHQLPATVWRKLIARAWAGEPKFLMDALLVPQHTDGAGRPLPGGWVALPDDAELRERIVNALMLGPWDKATSLAELATRSGWGRTKSRVNDLEIAVADLSLAAAEAKLSSALVDELAADLGLEADSLIQRIKTARQRLRRAASKKLP